MNEQIKNIDKEIMKTKIITIPLMMISGLGFYGAFLAKGNAFHPLLNNMDVNYSLLAIGATTMIWSNIKTLSLTKKRTELVSNENT